MNKIEFNGKNIIFKRINGVYWIGIKSVCEALNVNYNRQFQNIKEHPRLRAKFAKQQILVEGDTQPRKYICLPEEYIYGWIFTIKSDSPALLDYQDECYHILYKHFHGTITRRAELYSEMSKERKKIQELKTNLSKNPDYIELQSAEMKYTRLWKNLKDTTSNESDLFENE